MDGMRVFTINPGSTSTKIALFEDDRVLYSANVSHDANTLSHFSSISEQYAYRKQTIDVLLKENSVDLNGVAAVVGRGGGLLPMEGGIYEINEILLAHAKQGANGVEHPANLGPILADAYAEALHAKAYVVNPPDVDELQDVARITGIKGVYRTVHLHALSLKEIAIRHAAVIKQSYDECRFIVCHIGGGISISAHKEGRMIDGFDIVGGEGPMTPTRCGAVSVADLLKYSEGKGSAEIKALCTQTGGFVSWLETSDALEVSRAALAGDALSALLWNGMIYQIAKGIGSMATVLEGKIDGILVGGGMARDEDLIAKLTKACGWIAPLTAYPGEFEMEAMAAGACRAAAGTEQVKTYQGISTFQGFSFK